MKFFQFFCLRKKIIRGLVFIIVSFFLFFSSINVNVIYSQQDSNSLDLLGRDGGLAQSAKNLRDRELQIQSKTQDCKNQKGPQFYSKDGINCISDSYNEEACFSFPPSFRACLIGLFSIVISIIFSLINSLLNFILWAASWFLDVVFYITVVRFKSNFADLQLLGGGGDDLIYYLWGILRDFVNLLLLLTIIYHAVRTMFEGFEETRKKFLFLLLFSIIVNFSLFFVKIAIDISNILTLEAYTLMANPISFNTWEEFRERSTGEPGDIEPRSIGEYLYKMVELYNWVGKDNVEKSLEEGTLSFQDTAIYRVGLSIVYIGLIYIMFFLIMFLVLRAAAFLLAMVLAPLLAVDLFFGFVEKGSKDNPTSYKFVESIRGLTKYIKDDFLEALFRGPLLFFFLFLVGVLANGIFNQGAIQEITQTSINSQEFQATGNIFSKVLGPFLKFLIFFALVYVLFDKIKNIKISSGGGWFIDAGAKRFANFAFRNTVGRGLGAASYAGREFVGRRLMNNQKIKDLEASLTEMAQSKSTFGRLVGNRVANLGLRSINRVRTGSMDIRASKRAQKLAGAITKATADKEGKGGISLDFGKPAEGGYAVLDQKAKEKAGERLEEYIKTAQSGVRVTDKEAKAEITDKGKDKVDFAGGKFNAEELEEILNKREEALRVNLPNFTYNGKVFGTNSPMFIKDTQTNLSPAEAAIMESKKKFEKQKNALKEAKMAAVKTTIRKNVSEREGPGFITERIFDERTRGVLAEENRAKLVEQAKAEEASKKRERAQKISLINQFQDDAQTALEQVKTTIGFINEYGLQVDTSKLQTLKDELEKGLKAIPSGTSISEEDMVAFATNTALHTSVFDAKNTAQEVLSNVYRKGSDSLQKLIEARDRASDEYGVITSEKIEDTPDSSRRIKPMSGSREIKRRKIALEVKKRIAKAKLEKLNEAVRRGYDNAREIGKKAKNLSENMERVFSAKEEDQKQS